MSGVEKLRSKILEEARLTAENNLANAQKEAAGIRESAAKEAALKQGEIINHANSDAQDRKKKLIANAGLEARKMRLRTKQALVDEVFEKAVQKLNALPPTEYCKVLSDMIVSLAEDGREEIILSEKDHRTIGADLVEMVNNSLKSKGKTAAVQLAAETRNLNGGFILRLGDTEINNSFDMVLRIKREQLEAEVVKTLFGE